MTTRIVIDTDPGIDDFFAIVQALRSPELEVEALTTVGGNVPLRYTTRNALRAVEFAGRPDVPVFPGDARPLRGRFEHAFYFHGPGGLGAPMPLPRISPMTTRAVDYLAARADDTGSPRFTLVAMGPATNIARFLRRLKRPGRVRSLPGKGGPSGDGGRTSVDRLSAVERIVVMGGAVDVPGNVTPFAEFNTWNDPRAAAEVFEGEIPITLVPLDVCNAVKISGADFAQAHPTARRLGDAWLKRHSGRQLGLADCVAIAAITDPEAFRFERMVVEVDTSSGSERGRTRRLPLPARRQGGSPRRHISSRKSDVPHSAIDVAMEVDSTRVLRAIRERALASR